jgi:hypothetical protein
MKSKTLLASLACGALALTAACQDTPVNVIDVPSPSFASVHLKGGNNATPKFTVEGLTLNATGSLSGLGSENLVIFLEAHADVVAVCENQGGNLAFGQNPAPITLLGTQPVFSEKIKNGTVSFDVTTVAPENPIPGAPDCPNSNWSEIIEELIFTSATIWVEQPFGTEVFRSTWYF